MQPPQTPLFVKTHDFTVWMLRHTQRFPKNLRHSYTVRLENLCFDFEERIIHANTLRGEKRKLQLEAADVKLNCLRALLRYTLDLQILGSRQFEYAAKCVDELGRLLGAWIKGTGR